VKLIDMMTGRDSTGPTPQTKGVPLHGLVRHKGAWRRKPKRQHGIKRWYMLGELDTVVKTPYGAREARRRKAARRVAKQARKVNRGLRRTGGRL